MATILKVNRNNINGRLVLSALEQIAAGVALLERLDPLRANAIGTSTVEMETVFGVLTGQGQALSDRWGALIAAVEDPANAEFAKLRDLIYAVTDQ